jgi:glycosyltransferase involved in cell wall biosynthesis
MPRPTLSVITPSYNHAAYVDQAIESVVTQTRPPEEYLILDDASTDDSLARIERQAAVHGCIRLLRNAQNQGVVPSLSRLVQKARGDYVFCAAADDYALPGFFERAMQMAERHPRAGVIFGRMIAVDARGQILRQYGASRYRDARFISPGDFLRDYLEREPAYRSLSAATVYRRDCLLEVGGFRPELGHWSDTFAIRAIALKYGACYVPELFAAWRKLPDGLSQGTRRKLRESFAIVDRAAELMRSPALADRFPPAHVRSWRRNYRRAIVLGYAKCAAQQWWTALGRSVCRVPRTTGSATAKP